MTPVRSFSIRYTQQKTASVWNQLRSKDTSSVLKVAGCSSKRRRLMMLKRTSVHTALARESSDNFHSYEYYSNYGSGIVSRILTIVKQ